MTQADSELQAALAQFNQGLKVQQAEEKAKRAIDKAERRKQQAANTLKKVQDDTNASPDDKAEAEAAYRSAADEYRQLKAGDAPPSGDEASSEDGDASAIDESGDEAEAGEGAPEEAGAAGDGAGDAGETTPDGADGSASEDEDGAAASDSDS